MKQMPVPYLIRRVDDGAAVEIQWEQSGHVGRYGARALRLACRCASCREEMTDRPLLEPGAVPADVRALDIKLVGGYAVQFAWSDGHGTGIYPWDYLLEICPCAECASRRSAP